MEKRDSNLKRKREEITAISFSSPFLVSLDNECNSSLVSSLSPPHPPTPPRRLFSSHSVVIYAAVRSSARSFIHQSAVHSIKDVAKQQETTLEGVLIQIHTEGRGQ